MSDLKEVQNRKRKLENEDETEKEEEKFKRILISKPELLDLADELLMAIAEKLDGESLYNLSLTCVHLRNLVQDKRLWAEGIFTGKDLDIWEILKRLKYLTPGTKKLEISGNAKKESMESRSLKNRQTFKEIIKRVTRRSPFIEHLRFHQIWFDWTKDWSIQKFPASLKSLIFTHCIMPKDRNRMSRTFTSIFDHMPHLQELRLEYCNFFEPNDLMPLSKIQELKILSLRGCKRFRNCVPYISLSCRFGFKKLEVLDLRETLISDSEMQCLNSLKTLKELLLEQPEMEQTVENDSDEDVEFQTFFRTLPRTPSFIEQVQYSNDPNNPTSSSSDSQQPQPSTSRSSNDNNNDEPPSSPESLSDSLPESSSPTEELPPRTIFIQANITENPNQNARLQVIISDDIPHASRYLALARNREYRMPSSVTDRGILAFGVPRANLVGNLVYLGNHQADPNTYLERIVLRNFRNITDTTLSHLETNAPRLVFLDIRGCSQITREAVERFKITRGSCQLITNFDFEE